MIRSRGLPPPRRASRGLRALVALPCTLLCTLLVVLPATAVAQPTAEPARVRWERLCQIRRDQFDRILPGAMRDHGVDM